MILLTAPLVNWPFGSKLPLLFPLTIPALYPASMYSLNLLSVAKSGNGLVADGGKKSGSLCEALAALIMSYPSNLGQARQILHPRIADSNHEQ